MLTLRGDIVQLNINTSESYGSRILVRLRVNALSTHNVQVNSDSLIVASELSVGSLLKCSAAFQIEGPAIGHRLSDGNYA